MNGPDVYPVKSDAKSGKMQEKEDKGNPEEGRILLTIREVFRQDERCIFSPVTGSMLPLIRPKRDAAVFVRLGAPKEASGSLQTNSPVRPVSDREDTGQRQIRRYDVVLYNSGDKTIMHRVIGRKGELYLIRGDRNTFTEEISPPQIFAVMEGFYRDERYISCGDPGYRLISRLLVFFNPLMRLRRRLRRHLARISWLRALVHKIKGQG